MRYMVYQFTYKPDKIVSFIIDSMCFNASKLWNTANYERREYKELGFSWCLMRSLMHSISILAKDSILKICHICVKCGFLFFCRIFTLDQLTRVFLFV